MTGLRDVRRELQILREKAMSTAGGLVLVEAPDGLLQANLDAFLETQVGQDRAGTDVVVLRVSANEELDAPRIIGTSDESLSEILQAIDGKSRGLPSERQASCGSANA